MIYTLYSSLHSWNEVYDICQSLGASMLKFDTQEDFDAFLLIQEEWRTHGYLLSDMWIGLFDCDIPAAQFLFQWADCTPLVFTSWDSDEPNEKGTENCVRLEANLGYKTKNCSTDYATVCQTSRDMCWLEEIKDNAVDHLTPASVVEPVYEEDCKQMCLSFSSPKQVVCVAVEYNDHKERCRLFTGTRVLVLDEVPPMMTRIEHSVFIHRCYKGVYEVSTPSVTTNLNQTPNVICPETTTFDYDTSTASTISTTSEVISTEITIPSNTTENSSETTISFTTSTTFIPATKIPASNLKANTLNIINTAFTNPTTTVTTSPTKEVTTTTTPVSTAETHMLYKVDGRRCFCLDRDHDAISELQELIRSLRLKGTSLSKYKRTKYSVPDDRSVSIGVGNLGLFILGIVGASILLLDLLPKGKKLNKTARFK